MPIERLKETPSQTGGPYVHIGTLPAFAGLNVRTQEHLEVVGTTSTAPRIRIEGLVYDGMGAPIRDGLLEIWQADPEGRYNAGGFQGWGRGATHGETGLYHFDTVKPGATPYADGRPQAPHVTLYVFARGINLHLHTRMYFPEDEAALAADPVLRALEHAERRKTLIATKTGTTYRFDIRLQGADETVFFDV